MSRQRVLPFLLFFGSFPALSLFVHNIEVVHWQEIFLPLFVSLLTGSVLYVLINKLFHEPNKRAIFFLVTLILFYTYEPVSDSKFLRVVFFTSLYRHILVLIVYILILTGARFLLSCIHFQTDSFLRFLKNSSYILAGILVFDMISSLSGKIEQHTNRFSTQPIDVSSRPDIYYIILDGYGRSDILKKYYRVDNSSFLEELKKLGFYIPTKSRSNYCQTLQSLGSSLNMNYLDSPYRVTGALSSQQTSVTESLKKSEVFSFLKTIGYTTVSFNSGYGATDMFKPDILLNSGWQLSEFQNLYLSDTPLPALLSLLPGIENIQSTLHRERIKFILNGLTQVPEIASPKFVFAHIVSPHPPFLFGENGEEVETKQSFAMRDGSHYVSLSGRNDYKVGYSRQVVYVTKRILSTVKQIIKRSPRAVIIIQGDHGPGMYTDWRSFEKTNVEERFSIFNSYRVPQSVRTELYDTISPVNTFRVLFRKMFGAEIPNLEDRSYYFGFGKQWKGKEFVKVP